MTAATASSDEPRPPHRVVVTPLMATARAWVDDVLIAESDSALRLSETNHPDRLYFPTSDIDHEHLTPSDHHTHCPHKGDASYRNLHVGDTTHPNAVWFYPEPIDAVAEIAGHLCFYPEHVRIEIEERWPDDETRIIKGFPLWGDMADLTRLIDVQPVGPDRYESPPVELQGSEGTQDDAGQRSLTRNVVEGGQLLGEAIVAASKSVPDQRVLSAYMTFTRAARFDATTSVDVEVLRRGRTFSTVEVKVTQDGVLRAPCLMLVGADSPDLIRDEPAMPDVAGPDEAEPYDFRVTGRDIRIVDGAYDTSPHRVGPPVIYSWIRFRDDPTTAAMRQALIAQATTHWTYGAAMRPYDGKLVGASGEEIDLSAGAKSHVDLSAGVMNVSIAFHDDAPLDDWILYANPVIWAGRGMAHGDGKVFSRGGTLLATYTIGQMIREFPTPTDQRQLGADLIM